jgi:hypothetical protein
MTEPGRAGAGGRLGRRRSIQGIEGISHNVPGKLTPWARTDRARSGADMAFNSGSSGAL